MNGKRLLSHKRFGRMMGFVRRLQRPRNGLTRKVNNLLKRYQLSDSKCVLCSSSDFNLVSESDRFGFDLQKRVCVSCGLLQSNPLPKQEFFNIFYRDYYRNLYRGDRASHVPKLFDQQNERGARIYNFLSQQIPISNFAIYEIGCSYGGVLDAFRKNGLLVAGCDLDEEAINHACSIGIDASVGALPTITANRPTVYIMSHVLEHIPNPRASLNALSSIMTNNDFLYVEVPGLKSLLKGAYRGNLLNYFHVGHVSDFTASTLSSLMNTAGFKDVYVDENIVSLFHKSAFKDYHQVTNYYSETVHYIEEIEDQWERI